MDYFSVLAITELTRFAELLKFERIYSALKCVGTPVLLQLFTDLKGPVCSNGRLWFQRVTGLVTRDE